MSLLRAEGIERRYGARVVVDIDEMDVSSGEVVAVLGPNGAGKSTLFRLLLLLEKPDSGRILLDGRVVRTRSRSARKRLAGVFQRPYLFAGSVEDNIAYGLRARGVRGRERATRVAELLELLGLSPLARVPVHALSGGEAQRVALARGLAPRPELILLDEPTSNLDVTARRRFREDLARAVRAHAGSALLITHDPADAFALADRIAVMEAGRIVQTGPPDALVLEPATPFVAAFTGAELMLGGVVRDRADGLLSIAVGARESVLLAPDRGDVAPGAAVHVAYRPEDLLIASVESAGETSARNQFRVRVASLTPSAGLVRVRLEGDVALTALVTRGSAESLGLAPGRSVVAQLKATALRVFHASG